MTPWPRAGTIVQRPSRDRLRMSYSSRIALIIAAVLTAVGAVMYMRSQDTRAPALTPPLVERLLQTAADGVESRSPSKALSVTTDDAAIFGYRRAQIARMMARSMRDSVPGRLSISWRNLQVTERGNVGTAEFDVTVRERLGGTDAVYVESHISLELVKVRRRTWLGLGTTEQWLVSRAQSSSDLMIGD